MPYDRESNRGCQYWRKPEKPPSLATCRACPVSQFFCPGCALQSSCRIANRPKIFPIVQEFLARINAATRFHIQPFTQSIDDLPVRTWRYMQTAQQALLEEEAAERKDFENKLRSVQGIG